RVVAGAFDELNGVTVQQVGNVARCLDRLAVFVHIGIQVRALAFETYPPIKSGARRVVVAHVPFADESRVVTSPTQQQRKSRQLMAGSRAVDVVCDPVGASVLTRQETGAAR